MPKCDFDKQIGGFLEQVEERVASLGWQVNDGAVLSLFSFQKIKMHNDIEQRRDEIIEHPIIRAICGDDSAIPPQGVNVPLPSLSGTFQIVDADSS